MTNYKAITFGGGCDELLKGKSKEAEVCRFSTWPRRSVCHTPDHPAISTTPINHTQNILKEFAENGNHCGPTLAYSLRIKLAKVIIKRINGLPIINNNTPCPPELVTPALRIGLAGYDTVGSKRMGTALWWAKQGVEHRVKCCKEGNRCGLKNSAKQSIEGLPPLCVHCNGGE